MWRTADIVAELLLCLLGGRHGVGVVAERNRENVGGLL